MNKNYWTSQENTPQAIKLVFYAQSKHNLQSHLFDTPVTKPSYSIKFTKNM